MTNYHLKWPVQVLWTDVCVVHWPQKLWSTYLSVLSPSKDWSLCYPLLAFNAPKLRYESTTLILYKELSSPIFQSLSVSQSGIGNTCPDLHFVQYNKVNRCLARYSPRATTTNRLTNRAHNWPKMPILGQIWSLWAETSTGSEFLSLLRISEFFRFI